MNVKTLIAKSLDDLPVIARTILDDMKDDRIFALAGKMGAGKTTLIKALCDELGVEEVVASPTFALVNEYTDEEANSVFHFDFYRIEKIEEVYDIGYEEYFYSGDYCFIEWPELIVNLMPESYVLIKIVVMENEERIVSYKRFSN